MALFLGERGIYQNLFPRILIMLVIGYFSWPLATFIYVLVVPPRFNNKGPTPLHMAAGIIGNVLLVNMLNGIYPKLLAPVWGMAYFSLFVLCCT